MEQELTSFIKEHLPEEEHNEIPQELRKTLTLKAITNPKSKKERLIRNKQGFLNAKERRKLCLFRLLPKKSDDLKYEDFKDLRRLWKSYIRELLDLKNYVHPKETIESLLQTKLCRADYHGSNLTVTKSHCKSFVGMKGTILMETRNTLQIITKKNELKVIPKKNTSFSFELDRYVFTLSGTNMCCKPSERAVKKWKNKIPYDF
ncbi:ribonuclease P protein subunit p29 [Lepeophtheirus salmonis]|uniref:ribonuclease P protein subunit p29 n=1 Tax=Lepeophtheirus salmonis TaxID=72036 RepID=UPI001AE31D1D|nr:ribonuclease P protein subunit p29-like [Lepeophtheirus salmonis]